MNADTQRAQKHQRAHTHNGAHLTPIHTNPPTYPASYTCSFTHTRAHTHTHTHTYRHTHTRTRRWWALNPYMASLPASGWVWSSLACKTYQSLNAEQPLPFTNNTLPLSLVLTHIIALRLARCLFQHSQAKVLFFHIKKVNICNALSLCEAFSIFVIFYSFCVYCSIFKLAF